MSDPKNPIVANMLEEDAFSQWLGIEVLESDPGSCVLTMTIREDMVNGFGVCHGGITFAMADSALAFASNGRGRISVALENNINYTKKVLVGDILKANTEELQNGRTIGVYKVGITNQDHDLVAEFRGTVYRSGKKHSD